MDATSAGSEIGLAEGPASAIPAPTKGSPPSTPRYMDHFEENGLLYIIMEYADAGDLGRLLRGVAAGPLRSGPGGDSTQVGTPLGQLPKPV